MILGQSAFVPSDIIDGLMDLFIHTFLKHSDCGADGPFI